MKKALPLLLLLCILLAAPVSASVPLEILENPEDLALLPLLEDPAGGSEDPLISLSYLTGTFLPNLKRSFSAQSERLLSIRRQAAAITPTMRLLTLPADQRVTLQAGQQMFLLSGDVEAAAVSGALLDVTAGAEVSGPLEPGRRYVACENADVYVDVLAPAVMKVSFYAAVTDPFPFGDVAKGSWYYTDVRSAWRRGLVNGMTATAYAPQGTLTAAQCVKLAACMHQLWREGTVTLANSAAGPWYRSYVDYALENGIMDEEFADYDAVIDRLRFTHLFYRALPPETYTAVNEVPDGAIPDLDPAGLYAAEVYAFYRAGILTGYEGGAFQPARTITRAEAATLMNRMFDEGARKRFQFG